ncbi:MAG: hypothetical protein JNM22_17435 [Saprospiraceae bacterium]|nr:hypothetical protein [Saprospiraceae bacterium]
MAQVTRKDAISYLNSIQLKIQSITTYEQFSIWKKEAVPAIRNYLPTHEAHMAIDKLLVPNMFAGIDPDMSKRPKPGDPPFSAEQVIKAKGIAYQHMSAVIEFIRVNGFIGEAPAPQLIQKPVNQPPSVQMQTPERNIKLIQEEPIKAKPEPSFVEKILDVKGLLPVIATLLSVIVAAIAIIANLLGNSLPAKYKEGYEVGKANTEATRQREVDGLNQKILDLRRDSINPLKREVIFLKQSIKEQNANTVIPKQ